MHLRILPFFFCLLVCLYAQETPTITYITRERVVNIGDRVELQCAVENANDYPVIWVKTSPDDPSKALFISAGSMLVLPDQRYSIRHDTRSNSYTLRITKFKEIDAGVYQCQLVIGPSNKITADVTVHVRIPPVISNNSTRSAIVSEESSVTLYCYATGYPQPKIFWRREDDALLPNGEAVLERNVLKIDNITKDDRGTYYCVADNAVGKRVIRNVKVEVKFPPVITVDRPRIGQALQRNADLTCHIEAFPSPSIYWKKDDLQLNNNQHYGISIFATADEYIVTTLRVLAIDKEQYGNYTCVASNELGADSKVLELFETDQAVSPTAH